MTKQSFFDYTVHMNKIQLFAEKVRIYRLSDFRKALAQYGVSSGTAFNIWTDGATTQMKYAAIKALENILLVAPLQFLEDPENLQPVDQRKKGK